MVTTASMSIEDFRNNGFIVLFQGNLDENNIGDRWIKYTGYLSPTQELNLVNSIGRIIKVVPPLMLDLDLSNIKTNVSEFNRLYNNTPFLANKAFGKSMEGKIPDVSDKRKALGEKHREFVKWFNEPNDLEPTPIEINMDDTSTNEVGCSFEESWVSL